MTLSAYFDESGKRQEGTVCIAGAVSDCWHQFTETWVSALQRAGLPANTTFHRADYEARKSPFNMSREKYDRLLDDLIDCIKRNTLYTLSCSVQTEDWQKINASHQVGEKLGGPYALCGWSCVQMVMEWAKREYAGQPGVKCYFEDGERPKDKRDLTDKLIRLLDATASGELFLQKGVARQLEIGDLVGWTCRRVLNPPPRDERTPEAAALKLAKIRPLDRNCRVYSLEALETLCQRLEVPCRDRPLKLGGPRTRAPRGH